MFIPIEPVAPPAVVDDEGEGSTEWPPLFEREDSQADAERVMQLQFCLVQLGELRASGIRFHAGKIGLNTASAIR